MPNNESSPFRSFGVSRHGWNQAEATTTPYQQQNWSSLWKNANYLSNSHPTRIYAICYGVPSNLGQRYSAGGPAGQTRSAEWCEMTHEGSKTTNNIFLVG